ncbi:MAG: transposase [Clostridia bacterium]|nr:transposase [Clostridia bacterium]
MEWPKRKPNRLEGYDYSETGYYFITICTKDKKRILCDIVGDDAHIVPKKAGKIASKYIKNIREIDKYVIMPNHIHLILKIEGGTMWASSPTRSVPSIIRSLKTLVSKECGEKLWQRSYYDHIIRGEGDYLEIWKYIDENPLKWKEDRFFTP